MVTKVVIRDNTKSAVKYINGIDAFSNGKEYTFKPGVNIIVGENGSGKTTLMKLIEYYLMVGYNRCERGMFNKNVTRLSGNGGKLLDGVDVYADYTKNVFRLSHQGELDGEESMRDFMAFKTMVNQMSSSTGESVLVGINSLFSYMFSPEAELTFDYSQIGDDLLEGYADYVKEHKVECEDEYTILMDEPDRNLSLDNIKEIKSILSYHKEQTQIISVIHNPLIIYSLAKKKSGVNFIELTKGYVDDVMQAVKETIR